MFTARLTVTDSSGRSASQNTTITVGNTSPTVNVTVPVEGGLFAFGESIPFAVTVTDPEDGPIDCNRVEVTFVLAHDEHGHAEETVTGCSGVLPTIADDVSHGGNVWGVVSASYTDLGGAGGVPPLTTVEQVNVRQKLQQVEFALNQSGHEHGQHERRRRRPASRQPEQQRLDRAQRADQPAEHQLAHVPGRGRRRRRGRRARRWPPSSFGRAPSTGRSC